MKTKLQQLSAILALSIASYQAQVSAYTFTQSSSNYGAASNGTQVGQPMVNDFVSSLTLPFPFTFNGTTYNTLDVTDNGCLSFNSLSGFEYQPISDNSTQDLISPFGQDLWMGSVVIGDLSAGSNTITNCSSVVGFSVGDIIFDYGGDFGSVNPTITSIVGNKIVLNTNSTNTSTQYAVLDMNGYIKESVSGITPNRIFELEFRNFNRFAEDEVISFKVRLFETSNQIEFLYGTMIPGNYAFTSEVGLKGSSNSDFNSRKVTFGSNTWAASVASSNIADFCDFDPSIFPVSGQSYKWSPVSCTIPSLSVTHSNNNICAGQTATLIATGATTYSWVNGPASSQLTVNPTSTTNYTVIGENTSACASTLVVTQTVSPNPTLSISQSTTMLCAGQSATLTGSGATTYSWMNGPNTAQYIVSPSVTSTYTLNGTVGNCSSSLTSVQSVSICTGIHENSFVNTHITVYPNPFNTELQIKNTATTDVNVSIIDALGKVIYSTSVRGDATQVIETANLSKGLYFIKLSSGTESTTKKLVKE